MIDDHQVTEISTKSQRWQLKYFWNFQPEILGKMMNPCFDYFKMGWFNHQPPRHSPQNITFMEAKNGALEEEIPSFEHRVIFRFAKYWGCR